MRSVHSRLARLACCAVVALAPLVLDATAHAAPFAVSGPCYKVPTTGSPSGEPAAEGSAAAVAAAFHGDLDGDGVPDRALHLIPDLPGEDVLGEFHLFVMRGSCGHWVGGMSTTMTDQDLELGPKPVNGLRPIITTQRVSRGTVSEQWHYTGQGLHLALSKDCSPGDDCAWRRTPSGRPLARRPTQLQVQGAAVGADAVTLLFATLGRRGFTRSSPDTMTRGPLLVTRRAGSPDLADIRIEQPTTGDCSTKANTSRIGCGTMGRLGEIAEALGGCHPLNGLGAIEYMECRDGLLLQSLEAEKPTRVVLRGGAAEPSGPACDFFPHAGTVAIQPEKAYCIFQHRLTSKTPALGLVAEVNTGCTERTEGSVVIRTCEGVRFYFDKPKGTLSRIEFPAATPASK